MELSTTPYPGLTIAVKSIQEAALAETPVSLFGFIDFRKKTAESGLSPHAK